MANNKFTKLAIINITPDSFFDGGKILAANSFRKRLTYLRKHKIHHIDIGAESTAPKSLKVSKTIELNRFQKIFIPNIDELSFIKTLSIDTYRFSTFYYLYNKLRPKYPHMTLIWNDVSGVIDKQLDYFLKKCLEAKYIACHTFTKKRQYAGNPLNNQKTPENIIPYMKTYFDKMSKLFKKFNRKNDLILDPAFGFSKNNQQSIFLARNLDKLTNCYKDYIWCLGISNKRFLKDSPESSVKYLKYWKKTLSGTFFIREHI